VVAKGVFDSRAVFRWGSRARTTIQIDDALLAQAAQLAREKGCDLSRFIGDTLPDRIAPPPMPCQPLLRLTTAGGKGIRPGIDLDNSADLLALMEQGA
jgi:hypothetical protein